MRKGTAPDANVLITVRRRHDGMIIATDWTVWNRADWYETMREGVEPYIGYHAPLTTAGEASIEVMVIGEINV